MMVSVAVFSGFIISMGAKSRAFVVSEYSDMQGELLAISAEKFVLRAVHEHHNNLNCVDDIVMHFPKDTPEYEVNIKISYMGKGLPCQHILDNTVQTKESNATMVIDVFVQKTGDRLRQYHYHKRTLIKP